MKKVTLRAIEPEDLDLLYEIENDESLWQISSSSAPYSRYVLHQYVATTKNDIFADGQVRFVIQNARKTPVGMIDLANFDAKNNRAEVGVVIRKRYAGKGYGQAAVLKLLNYAQEILGLCQVYAIVSCDNVRAKNLFNKTGFQTVATLPQWLALGGKYVDALLYQFVFQSK